MHLVRKPIVTCPQFGEQAGSGRVLPGIKEVLNLPFLVLKARHPAPQHIQYSAIRTPLATGLIMTYQISEIVLITEVPTFLA